MINKKKKLIEIKKGIEPKTIFWNQNNLFLTFGIAISLFITSGIELFKIIASEKYNFNLRLVLENFFSGGDWYLYGIFLFFLFGFIISILIAHPIDKTTKHFQKLLFSIDEEINKL
jgi:hypothetical protein